MPPLLQARGLWLTAALAGLSVSCATQTQDWSPAPAPIPRPTALKVWPTDGGSVLSWNPVAKATGYRVRRTQVGMPSEIVASINQTTFTDSELINGTDYSYSVSALTAAGEGWSEASHIFRPVAGAFFAPLDAHDDTRFEATDNAVGSFFNCYYKPDHVSFSSGRMSLTLDDTANGAYAYTSGEYRTKGKLSYGTFETSMQASPVSGVVSSFFTFEENGDEIDFEFVGVYPQTVACNYYVHGPNGFSDRVSPDIGPYFLAPMALGLPDYNAATAFHKYTIRWEPTYITWYIDDFQVLTTQGHPDVPLPTHPMHLYQNLWDSVALESMVGPFNYTSPTHATYEYFYYAPSTE